MQVYKIKSCDTTNTILNFYTFVTKTAFNKQDMNKKKIALIIGGIIGVGVLGYLGYWMYKKSKTRSGNPQKDNRNIQIVRA